MTVLEDLRRLTEQVRELAGEMERLRTVQDRHEEQMNGQRGLSAAVDSLAAEVKSLRKAAYWVAGIIIVGAVTFAFSALSLVGHV